jgi:predicted Zn-dependent protease
MNFLPRLRSCLHPERGRRTLALLPPLILILALPLGRTRAASWDDLISISEDQEIALGREVAAQVQAKLPMLADPLLESYVINLGQRLARGSGRPNLPYTFRVVDVAEVNAFALPGGHVFVQRGLLDVVTTEMELAGVLAHEVGHVVGRHAAKQVGRQRLLEAGAGIMSQTLGGGQGRAQGQGDQPGLTQVAINLLANGVLLKYSRDQENEADQLGFAGVVKAGYDPRGLITFLQTLLARQRENPNALAQLFATHPPSEERIHALSARWWAARPPEGLIVDSPDFHRMKARLATLPPPRPMPKDPPQSPQR